MSENVDTSLLFEYLFKIDKYFNRNDVTEIMIMENGSVLVEDFKNGFHLVPENFSEHEKKIIIRTIAHVNDKQAFTNNNYSIAATLPKYGSRVQMFTPPLTRGCRLNFRISNEKVISLLEYFEMGLITEQLYNYFLDCLINEKNIIIGGKTGSGKTTLLNALIDSIPDDCKKHLYIIEDRPEIKCNKINHTKILVDPKYYSHRQALHDALRMAPTSIFFGEVRGGEAFELLKSWETGHRGGMATIHTNSAVEAIMRLKRMCEEVVVNCDIAMICGAVQLIIYIEKIRENGKTKFIVKQAIEPISYNSATGLNIKEVAFY